MAQAKKKTATKTAKKTTARAAKSRATRTTAAKKTKDISNAERWHIYLITGMSMITVILLCADAAMLMA